MASNVLRGRLLGVRLAGSDICVTRWRIREETDEQDVTNSCSDAESDEFAAGSVRWNGSFEGFWTSSSSIHSSPPDINAGQTVAAIFLLKKTATVIQYTGDILLLSIETNATIKESVGYSVEFRGTGVLTKPTF